MTTSSAAIDLRRPEVSAGSRSHTKRVAVPSLAAVVPWLVPACLIGIWQAGSSLGFVSTQFLPSPADVIAAAYGQTMTGELPTHIAVSFQRAASGFLLGGSLAFVFGLVNGLSRTSELLTDTTFQMIRNVPNLALIPLVILWFGVDEGAKLFLTSIGVFFPIYINTFHGVRTVDAQLIEMARSYGIGRFNLFLKVILPGALPSIFVGVRFALGIMWLTLIVAETIAAKSGIGYMAMNAREFMLIDVVVLSIVVYALFGKLADVTARALERRTLSWHPSYQKV